MRSNNSKILLRDITIYTIIAAAVAASYHYVFGLLAIQTAWINAVIGKASVSTVLALILWVAIIEKIGKQRKWSSRRIWLLLLAGVMVLLLSVQYTPV